MFQELPWYWPVYWQFFICSPLQLCIKEGGACVTTLDGYYVESVVCVAIGLAWWLWLGKKMRRLQEQSPSAWRCRGNQWWHSSSVPQTLSFSFLAPLHTLLWRLNGGHIVTPTSSVWFSPSGPARPATFRKHSLSHCLTSVTLKHINLMKDTVVSGGKNPSHRYLCKL